MADDSKIRCTLYRCKAESLDDGTAAADGRCGHWTFGPGWACMHHADAGVEPFVMVSEAEVDKLSQLVGVYVSLLGSDAVAEELRPLARECAAGDDPDRGRAS